MAHLLEAGLGGLALLGRVAERRAQHDHQARQIHLGGGCGGGRLAGWRDDRERRRRVRPPEGAGPEASS